MVKHDDSPAVLQVVRYGLPLVILIFYVSASWNFSYTPDSTFLSLRMASSVAGGGMVEPMGVQPGGTPDPLWVFFLTLASMLNIDSLLAAKIFSLFFSSVMILLTYLLASELLRDRFLAFCAALAVATNGLVLQVAPGGSPVPLALTLVLAGLFFMLRNDYLVSAVVLGLGTIVCWQAAGAFLVLLLDAWMNSTTVRHRARVILFSILVYVGALLPWLVFASLRAVPPVPWLVGLDDFPEFSLVIGAAAIIPALIAAAAVVGVVKHKEFDGLARRTHIVVILWAVWFLICFAWWGWDFWLFALPVIIIYALSSAQQFAPMRRSGTMYMQALVLAGVVIFLHQFAFNHAVKPAMTETEMNSDELVELAYWIKNGVPEEASISAKRPELLAYYAGRPVGLWNPGKSQITEYLISEEEEVWGYSAVQRASRLEGDELIPGAGRFAVWRKK